MKTIDEELFKAIHINSFAKVKKYLDEGANPNVENKDKKNSLSCAAFINNKHIFEILIDHYANINHVDKDGFAVIHLVAENSNVEAMKLLIESEVDINALDPSGDTALHISSFMGNYNLAVLLVELGKINTRIRNKDGLTALDVAIENRHQEIINYLKNK